jgi:hypothetical protein
MKSTLPGLQKWYAAQCNGTWEHGGGIEITTLDNPGWMVTIDLKDTKYGSLQIPSMEHGMGEADTDWIKCWSQEEKFRGVGDPSKLEAILEYFLTEIERNDSPSA